MVSLRVSPRASETAARRIEEWRARGRSISTRDGSLWVLDEPGEDPRATPALLLHGFPSSSLDFAPAIDRLGGLRGRRVVTLDLLGFGLSDKPVDYGYSLFEQAETVFAVASAIGLKRAHVWAHDMGTSVTTELLALRERGQCPLDLASVTLMNGSVHVEMAHLTPGQQILRSPLGRAFAKLTNRPIFGAQVRRTFARRPDDETVEAMWQLLERDGGAERMAQTIRYLEERTRFRRRWIGALERLDLPALVAWGRRDPVAVFAIAQQLAREIPGARFEVWDDLGHWPQLEDPGRVAATVNAFWSTVDGRS
jgi:pimeloyl-ACP methyl ester carboxylesterase